MFDLQVNLAFLLFCFVLFCFVLFCFVIFFGAQARLKRFKLFCLAQTAEASIFSQVLSEVNLKLPLKVICGHLCGSIILRNNFSFFTYKL
jgi:hypothetical protein